MSWGNKHPKSFTSGQNSVFLRLLLLTLLDSVWFCLLSLTQIGSMFTFAWTNLTLYLFNSRSYGQMLCFIYAILVWDSWQDRYEESFGLFTINPIKGGVLSWKFRGRGQKRLHHIFWPCLSHLKSGKSGIKSKCKIHIMRPNHVGKKL